MAPSLNFHVACERRFALHSNKALSMTDNHDLWFRFSIPLGAVPFLFSFKTHDREEKKKEKKRIYGPSKSTSILINYIYPGLGSGPCTFSGFLLTIVKHHTRLRASLPAFCRAIELLWTRTRLIEDLDLDLDLSPAPDSTGS